ncbi:hypothetical protein [Candidatus Nitrotoga sp. 1052]|uniref:hypothetical protein n=1 Tax=Candidatus Nitrotoga sp. 1052 TaxID=2886964 RepID=UPI001EF46D11|nr:hypothetical protein [Candidatus Nitrotoga sp. 1052]CAH1069455.1 hypothetical protein NTG1052_100013 [Candidatus Nitrotoga sp. 1052]
MCVGIPDLLDLSVFATKFNLLRRGSLKSIYPAYIINYNHALYDEKNPKQKLLALSLLEKTFKIHEMQMGIIRAYYHVYEKKLQVFAFQCNEQ